MQTGCICTPKAGRGPHLDGLLVQQQHAQLDLHIGQGHLRARGQLVVQLGGVPELGRTAGGLAVSQLHTQQPAAAHVSCQLNSQRQLAGHGSMAAAADNIHATNFIASTEAAAEWLFSLCS